MRKSPNKLWALGPIISVLLIVAAYYLKVPAFRDAVNARIPWAKEHLSQFVPPPKVIIVEEPSPVPTPPKTSAGPPPARPAVVQAARQTPAPIVRDEGVTMQAFAANPALWPKTVKLKCATEFPAVLNGKKIGKVQAPAGAETHLVMVRDQQLGLEYRGGGAWVSVSQTDLTEKVKITLR